MILILFDSCSLLPKHLPPSSLLRPYIAQGRSMSLGTHDAETMTSSDGLKANGTFCTRSTTEKGWNVGYE